MVRFASLALAATLSAIPAAASAAVFLNMGSGADCRGQSCFAQSRHYERSWSAGLLDGPMAVNAITLDRSLLGRLQDHMFTVNFYSSDGTLVGSLGSFTIAGLVGDTLTLRGQGFTWNPEDGDLTVRLTLADWAPPGLSNASPGGGGGGGFAPFVFRPPAAAATQDAPGPLPLATFPAPAAAQDLLVSLPQTSFDEGSQLAISSPNPEPGTWALMITGFGLAGAALRRRRTLAA